MGQKFHNPTVLPCADCSSDDAPPPKITSQMEFCGSGLTKLMPERTARATMFQIWGCIIIAPPINHRKFLLRLTAAVARAQISSCYDISVARRQIPGRHCGVEAAGVVVVAAAGAGLGLLAAVSANRCICRFGVDRTKGIDLADQQLLQSLISFP